MSSRWDSPNTEAQASASSSSSSSAAAAAAAAAAAKIAAQFASKAPSQGDAATTSSSEPQRKERETHDAEFTHDIEINDQRNRYMLTKGQTQQQIHRETGASVTTKGTWYPDKALATKEDPPLYLHVEAISQEILDAGIAKINELMAQEVPQLVEDRHQRRLDYESQRPPPRERRRWPEEKVLVNLENIRNFNVRSKIVGPGGMFVKYIQNETGTRVQIKGLGSGFIESDTGMELNEPMHIAIAGPEDEQIQAAKVLADDLLEVVRSEWQKAYDAMGQGYNGGGGGGRGGYGGGYDGGAPRGGGYGRSHGYGRGGSPAGASGYGHHQQQQQQGGWDQQRGGWNHHQHQQQQSYTYNSRHNGDPAPPPTDDGAPPPPPPEDDAPPPPPTDSASHRPYAAAGAASQQQRNSASGSQHASSPAASQSRPPAAAASAKSPEEEALDKYWREYVEWETSFRAYHHRAPTKEEGGQDVPPQYRK